MEYYNALFERFGPQMWWPARTRFEVIVGAILTQNTNWGNVERAVRALRGAGGLTPKGMNALSVEALAELIRPSGYFNVKARRLKNFLTHLNAMHGGSLNRLFGSNNQERLRTELLSINGIGPETADSILLYAGGRAEFVVDAYTRRILSRHGLIEETSTYGELKEFFTSALAPDAALFNEYHALIVVTGKEYCRPRAQKCEECPLKLFL
ncbi:MAG: endonuclease III domain-containing protein [Proteobacteria bacterium]|nr:endonuclease III domain-containing protein [Pseudomonadota bacterium]